uniref:Protein ENHANCED DISEASE RESISTANCE 2 C-terminal domain-containing protein n=1 Tax=Hanusia phi TaxID=3032 RepID=A0A7S0NC99_9CRYP|mmetsp:Transcript_6094/g.14069  ORF Transcript_6094/g.14069 Transcript_6094/m.14069 type:complete len:275 (+) Transcript_6094:103-927(+)
MSQQDLNGTTVTLGPKLQFGAARHNWQVSDVTKIDVRGKNYLKDRQKIPSETAAFNLVSVHGFTAADKIRFVTKDQRLKQWPRTRIPGTDKPKFMFVMHFDVEPQHLVLAFELNEEVLDTDKPFARTWKRFLEGNDAYKSERMKLITSLVQANWVVRKAVGKPVPAILGNKLTTCFHQTDDLLEATCDVTSSVFARAILSVIRRACKEIVCDLLIWIESKEEDELPERIFGGVRIINMDMLLFDPIDKKSIGIQPSKDIPADEVTAVLEQENED